MLRDIHKRFAEAVIARREATTQFRGPQARVQDADWIATRLLGARNDARVADEVAIKANVFRFLPALLAATILATPAAADDVMDDFTGRLELTGRGVTNGSDSLDASLGHQTYFDAFGNLRLMWEPVYGDFDLSVHYQLSGQVGESVDVANQAAALSPAPPPPTLFDLEHTLVSSDDMRLTHRIDRLAIGYSAPDYVIRVGRQALTWGAGMVFHPLDLVDPFAPTAVDTEFKPGLDMIYGQYLFEDGSNLEAIAVPRAPVFNDWPRWDDSTFAMRFNTWAENIGITATLARDRGDIVAGLGVGGPIGDATWNAELMPTFLANGDVRVSALANISTGFMIGARNATAFVEYFHNGFGVGGSGTPLDQLPGDLTDRMTRGQLFTTSRDYVAAGVTVEATPLLTLSPTAIVNLNDLSVNLTAQANWSVGDNTNIIFGANVPLGDPGTEFGGRALTAGGSSYATPATTAYVQLRQYF